MSPPVLFGSKEASTRVSRERDNSVDRYAVEQLEPKILFSAGPIDAPPETYGLSPLDSVDSSALEEVHFAEVVEVEMGPEVFDSDATEASVLGDGEDFNWGSETGPVDLPVGEGNEDLAAPKKGLVNLEDDLAETGDQDGGLRENFGVDQAAEM
ncbi:MAG: LEPR-XLL domain-containing protein, partial [Akkermansiaceae bacterium]|nr:LEPR-XLL domain-containing protein [Akkermansiaceae bacterium]